MNAQVAPIGHNNPPVDPFEAISVHVNDLSQEARNFLDGEEIATQQMADAVSKLMDSLRQASKAADAARVVEKKPHDEAAKAVQSKWKPLIDGCDTAVSVCKRALQPFLIAQEDEKRRIADEARAEAQRKAEEAAKAVREAHALDLAAQEAAEAQLKGAKKAEAAANKADQDRGRAAGGGRAVSLRDNWVVTLTDSTDALRWAWVNRKSDLEAFALILAKQEVSAGKRDLPGFLIENVPVVV